MANNVARAGSGFHRGGRLEGVDQNKRRNGRDNRVIHGARPSAEEGSCLSLLSQFYRKTCGGLFIPEPLFNPLDEVPGAILKRPDRSPQWSHPDNGGGQSDG
jgi:hypothetical protein